MAPMSEQPDQYMDQLVQRNTILEDLLLLKKDGGNIDNGNGKHGERNDEDHDNYRDEHGDKEVAYPSVVLVTKTAWTQITNTAWTTQTATAWTTQTATTTSSSVMTVVVPTPIPTSTSSCSTSSSVSLSKKFVSADILTTYRHLSRLLQHQQQHHSRHHSAYQVQSSQEGKVYVLFLMELHVKVVRPPHPLLLLTRPLVQTRHRQPRKISLHHLRKFHLHFMESKAMMVI